MVAAGQHSIPPQGVSVHKFTVRVLLNARGQWEVVLPDRRRPLRCRDLDEAQRVAYTFAERSRPCEVVVHDAYHRVVRRDLINGHRVSAPAAPPGSDAPRRHI
ncbi:MAG TPA: hypothetical protein VMJ65_17095 [Solirubrobacteraceae bacterium]|nr:hypothetical protein [Solirubrobacteraceae bacterium]